MVVEGVLALVRKRWLDTSPGWRQRRQGNKGRNFLAIEEEHLHVVTLHVIRSNMYSCWPFLLHPLWACNVPLTLRIQNQAVPAPNVPVQTHCVTHGRKGNQTFHSMSQAFHSVLPTPTQRFLKDPPASHNLQYSIWSCC